jgi:hypothetical protein
VIAALDTDLRRYDDITKRLPLDSIWTGSAGEQNQGTAGRRASGAVARRLSPAIGCPKRGEVAMGGVHDRKLRAEILNVRVHLQRIGPNSALT